MDIADNITKQIRKGVLDFIVLSTLQSGEKYPREIIEELDASGLSLVEGTIYPLFLRLCKNEFVTYEWQEAQGHPRKYYALTKKGHKALTHYMAEWEKLNSILDKINKG